MICYVLPTRNRPERLAHTLAALGRLGPHRARGRAVQVTVAVVDNASSPPPTVPERLSWGAEVILLRRRDNAGAAARNDGLRACHPGCRWIVMLDDDSHPMDTRFVEALDSAPPDVGAVAAEIFVPRWNGREAGGLPEVFVGCGVAIRRDLFASLGGYDRRFHYYVEEYDLAARVLLAGMRVTLDRRFRVAHHKDPERRNMGLICRRLVRNNAWIMLRYAPRGERLERIADDLSRYFNVALRERALRGYALGLGELAFSWHNQPRREMPGPIWERFTGLAHARAGLRAAYAERPFRRATLVEVGKNAWAVVRALRELGVEITDEAPRAEALVIATLSPGPMLDAWQRLTSAELRQRLIAPWPEPIGQDAHAAAGGPPHAGAVLPAA